MVFRMLFASFYRAGFPSRHIVSRTGCVLLPICGTRRASKIRIEPAAACMCTEARVRARTVLCTKPSQNAKPEEKLHTLLYENASSPKAQRDSVHAVDGTGTRCWVMVS